MPAVVLSVVVCSASTTLAASHHARAVLDAADGHARAVLDVVRQSGAESCPDRSELESRVAGYLGYQPFVDRAALHAEVVIKRTKRGLEANVRLSQAGKAQGRRVLDSPSTDCSDLASALALAISIAIDPINARKAGAPPPVNAKRAAAPPSANAKQAGAPPLVPAPPPPLPPPPPPSSPPAPPAAPPLVDRGVQPAPAPARPSTSQPLSAQLGAGALESLGTAPAIATGLDVYAGAIAGPWSLGLEGRADLPASRRTADGRVQSSLLLATLLPCFHHAAWFGCLSGSAGALEGTGSDIAKPEKRTTFYAVAGARSGLEIALSRSLELDVFGGLGATLTRTTLTLAHRQVWTTPTLSGFLASSVIVTFADGNRRLSAIR